MAKGLAVISGSNTVVFKALENGVVKMGGVDSNLVLKPAIVTISGSLTVSGSDGIHMDIGGSEYKLENLSGLGDKIVISGSTSVDGSLRGGLAWQGTSSMPEGANGDPDDPDYLGDLANEHLLESPDDFVVINSDGHLRRANKIDASVVMLNNGQTLEQQVGDAKLRLVGTSVLDGDSTAQVSLTKGDLEFVDVANRTRVTVGQDDPTTSYSSSVKIDLDPNLRVETLSASAGLEVTGSSNLKGKLHVVGAAAEIDDNLDVHGAATVDGDMTVKGNLNVWGDTTVTTADSKHLSIEDAIINIGKSLTSSSTDTASGGVDGASSQFDLGFVFGDSNKRAIILSGGDFYMGLTSGDAGDTDVDVNYETGDALNLKLYVPNLSASSNISALTLNIGDTADIVGNLTAHADVTLGDAASDTVTINGTLTASAPARFVGVVNAESDVTLEDGANLTMVNGQLTINQGSIDVQAGDLDVNGITTLSASAGGDTLALDVKGQTVLSSSADVVALQVESGNTELSGTLSVLQGVSLNSAAGALNHLGVWDTENQPAVQIAGSLNVEHNVRLGTDGDDKIIVQGQMRAPIFQKTGGALAGVPEIPAEYLTNTEQADHAGYMFYLKGDGIPNTQFANGDKWYFNEGGYWHSSFFWDDRADELGADGL